MKTLILSDLHIGDPRFSDSAAVIKMLYEGEYDTLLLLGDIIDLWLADLKDIIFLPLFTVLNDIALIKHTVWVIGNHDSDVELTPSIAPNIQMVNRYEINEAGVRVLCIHGNQVYRNNNINSLDRFVSRVNYWIWRLTGLDLQSHLDSAGFYVRYANRKRQQVLDVYGENEDVVIIAHTHHTGYLVKNGLRLYDVGSAIMSRSYGIVENGEVTIKYI
jgi:predicted phosphodiesterase